MNRTNISLHDRRSLINIITFIEQLLSESGTMSKDYRKRAIQALKRYQDALVLIEELLIKTGGHFSITNKDEVSHEKLVKDSVE